jgi:WD40 repeat protein
MLFYGSETMQAFQDVFISYGRKDSLDFAAKLNRRLVDRGFIVWFDYDDIPLGVDYQKQIDDGIERADNFLFIISPHAVNSPYCHLEIELALKHQKRIIPILHIEKISRETWQERNPHGTDQEWTNYQEKGLHDHFQNLHPEIRKINWVYMREGKDSFEATLTELLKIFDRHKDYVHQHTVFLTKALEWERNQKRSLYLLIGEERLQAEEWLKVQFKDAQSPCILTDLHCEFITESRKNANNLMTEVFLSYAEENRSTAEQIRNCLRREGFTVWTNTTDIHAGAEFQQVIDRGIEEADNVVYLLSPAAVRSSWCQHELEVALSLNKRIIPVRVEAIEQEQIPLGVRMLQYIDLTHDPQNVDSQNVDRQNESQLLRILRQDAAYHETHKLLLTKALKWERQQHNPTMLLRGYNLRQAEAWLKLTKQVPAYPALPLQETLIAESLRHPPGVSMDVFISYSRSDSGFARRLNDALQIQGKRTWFDQESIAAGTADFQQEIHHGIEIADTFLFILSPRSVASPYCADEVEYAASLNKRFITLLHQPIDPATLHPELAKVQWLDFNRYEGDFSANFTDLLRILDTDAEHLQAHTRLLMRAIEWDDKGRKESLLLREEELTNAEQWLTQSAGKEPKPTELQQSYITNSRTVEDANQQASQILEAAAAKGKRLVTVGAIAGAIGLLVAGVAGWFALQAANQIKVAEIRLELADAREEVLSAQQLQSLLTTLEASKVLRTQFEKNSPEWQNLQPLVMAALQQATNEIYEQNTLRGHQAGVLSISSSPDGKTIASGSGDNTIKLWDVATGKEIRTLRGHQAAVLGISSSPDGKTIASGSYDNTIKLWDVATGKEIRTLQGHQAGVNSISFNPDGKTIASASQDNTLKLWDVATGKEIRTLQGHQKSVWGISFNPDGKTIASGSSDNTIKLWDVATGKEIRTLQGHQAAVLSISFNPDGKTIASGSSDNTIKLWDVATGEEIRTLRGHQSTASSIRFSPDGQTIASGSDDKTIKLWNVATVGLIPTFQEHQGVVWSISFSPDGKTIASGSGDKTIKLWDAATGKEVSTLQGHQAGVNSISFSPDGKTIASGSSDKTIKLWDVATGKEIRTLQGHQKSVWSIRFSPDGETIASGSHDNTIKLWDVTTGKEIRTLQGHQAEVNSIRFSLNGKAIASGSGDNTIKLWDVATGKEIRTLEGHQNVVTSISFSPDGKTIASGSFDQTIKLWKTETGELLHTFQGHQDAIWSISFSPDGKTIASGSQDKTNIKLWIWDYDRLMTLGCDWIGTYLTTYPEKRALCKGYLPAK